LRLAHISPIASFEGMKQIVAEATSLAPASHIFVGSTVDAEGRRIGLKPLAAHPHPL
jgi:hypothetical protein